MIEISANNETGNARIMVIGVGGGGNNAVNSMIEDGVKGVSYACLNTDKQALDRCHADSNVQIGKQLTKGLGAGAKPEVGEAAALENEEEVRALIKGQDMVIVTCGMGGGTGTGAAPVVAKISHELGILTVGVVTRPFAFEAKTRMQNAMNGIDKLKQYTDTLIVISNNKLLEIVDRKTTMPEALKKSDMILKQAIQGITDLINLPALINLDFADITTIMKDKGTAYIGIGTGHGENRILEAVENALNSPLLEASANGATHVILNISGDITLLDANEGADRLGELIAADANVIFGAMYDDSEKDTVTVTIIATGVDQNARLAGSKAQVEATEAAGMSHIGGSNLAEQDFYGRAAVHTSSDGHMAGNTVQNPYGSSMAGNTVQNPYGSSMAGNMAQNPYGSNLAGNTAQNPYGSNLAGNTAQNPYAGNMTGSMIQKPYEGGAVQNLYTAAQRGAAAESAAAYTGRDVKISEFQSRKDTGNELKFSTIQSKAVRPKQTQVEESRYYDEEEDEEESTYVPDFLKRFRRKK